VGGVSSDQESWPRIGRRSAPNSSGSGRLRRRVLAGSVSVSAGLLLFGCSSSPNTIKPVAGLVASAQPHTSGPAVCHTLASKVGLRQLPSALENLYSKPIATKVHNAIANAITELSQLGDSAPKALAQSIQQAETSLRPLLAPLPTPKSVVAASNNVGNLATQVQQTCHFSKP